MRKILFSMTLILPLLISNGSWASDLPECEGSPLSASNWRESFDWDDCQGTYTWTNGDQYVGEWKDGRMHGQGTYTYATGRRYVGEYKNAKKHGQGTFTYPDGSKAEGIWKENIFLYENIVITAEDEKFCQEIGFKVDTSEYDKCVQKSAEQD